MTQPSMVQQVLTKELIRLAGSMKAKTCASDLVDEIDSARFHNFSVHITFTSLPCYNFHSIDSLRRHVVSAHFLSPKFLYCSFVGVIANSKTEMSRIIWKSVFVCTRCRKRLIIFEPSTKRYDS